MTEKPDRPAPSLTERIHRVYADLPSSERKAADLVLDRPGDLAAWQATELASHAGVSAATVSRFVRRLGYAGFEEARRAARAMRASGAPLYLAEAPRYSSTVLGRHLAVETGLVEGSLTLLNPVVLRAVAERLAGARRVRCAGFRNSSFIADYARATLGQMRADVERLEAPGQTLAEAIATLGPEDVALVVGLRRRPRGFVPFVRAVAATGADVVLLADRSVREAPALARWTLYCQIETPSTLDSYVGALAILRAVAVATLGRLDGAGRRHMERIETLHDRLDELE